MQVTRSSQLLVDGCRDRRAKFRKLRETAAVTLKEVFNASAVGEFGFLLCDTNDVLELSEEEDADAHRAILARRVRKREAGPDVVGFRRPKRAERKSRRI
jgi:hypothetical protein